MLMTKVKAILVVSIVVMGILFVYLTVKGNQPLPLLIGIGTNGGILLIDGIISDLGKERNRFKQDQGTID